MSQGKSVTTSLERYSGSVRQTRHIRRSGSVTIHSGDPVRETRPIGFRVPADPREVGEALWTAKDIL